MISINGNGCMDLGINTNELSALTNGFSGAMIEGVVKNAVSHSLIKKNRVYIEREELIKSIQEIRESNNKNTH